MTQTAPGAPRRLLRRVLLWMLTPVLILAVVLAPLAYLPLNETLTKTIRAEGGSQSSGFSLTSAAVAGFRHYYLRQSRDDIGEANGYTVLVDGVHLNDRGAATCPGH